MVAVFRCYTLRSRSPSSLRCGRLLRRCSTPARNWLYNSLELPFSPSIALADILCAKNICGLPLHWFRRTESAEYIVFDSHRHTPVLLAFRNTVRSPNFTASANASTYHATASYAILGKQFFQRFRLTSILGTDILAEAYVPSILCTQTTLTRRIRRNYDFTTIP